MIAAIEERIMGIHSLLDQIGQQTSELDDHEALMDELGSLERRSSWKRFVMPLSDAPKLNTGAYHVTEPPSLLKLQTVTTIASTALGKPSTFSDDGRVAACFRPDEGDFVPTQLNTEQMARLGIARTSVSSVPSDLP